MAEGEGAALLRPADGRARQPQPGPVKLALAAVLSPLLVVLAWPVYAVLTMVQLPLTFWSVTGGSPNARFWIDGVCGCWDLRWHQCYYFPAKDRRFCSDGNDEPGFCCGGLPELVGACCTAGMPWRDLPRRCCHDGCCVLTTGACVIFPLMPVWYLPARVLTALVGGLARAVRLSARVFWHEP